MTAVIATIAVGLVIAGVGLYAAIMSNREDEERSAKQER